MFKYVRAGGVAGAVLALVAATTLSDPTEASSLTAPQAPTYLSHAGAAIDGAALDQALQPATAGAPVAAAPAESTAAPAALQPAALQPAAVQPTAPAVIQPAPVPPAAPAPAAAAPETGHTLASLASGLINALNSIVSPAKTPLREMVDSYAAAQIADPEHECLAGAVYFEARSEPLEGQLAVADVVLNRTRSGRYPTTICAVVTQKAQFSFIRNGRFPRADRDSEAWRKAVAIAHIARGKLASQVPSNVLWYHATYVSPSWGRRLTKVNQIGLHIFYS